METASLAWIAAGAAGLAAFWGSLRSVLDWVFTLFVGKLSDPSHHFGFMAISNFAWYKCKRLNIGSATIRVRSMQLRDGKEEQVVFEIIGGHPLIFFYGWVPLIITNASSSNGDNTLEIRYIRGTIKPDSLFKAIYHAWAARIKADRFQTVRISGNLGPPSGAAPYVGRDATKHGKDPWESIVVERVISHRLEQIGQPRIAQSVADLSLQNEVLDAISEIRSWLGQSQWYLDRGIPWKRGWLLSGPPGSGKTSLVRAIGIELDLPVFSFDLATMSNSDLADSWQDMRSYAPCIVLIEDIDAVFDKRENLNKTMSGGLTFDCLLNCISGVQAGNGVFVVLTTNDLTKIDPALYDCESPTPSRPGRIDRHIVLDRLNEEGRQKIAYKIIGDTAVARQLIADSTADTAAQFTERCVQTALAEKHKDVTAHQDGQNQ